MTESADYQRLIMARETYGTLPAFWASFEFQTYEDIRNLILSFCAPNEQAKMLPKLREYELAKIEPSKTDGWRLGTLVDELRFAVSAGRERLDPMSFTGSIIPPGFQETELEWQMLSLDWILRPLLLDGFLNITGRPRMGKTNIASVLIQGWLERDEKSRVLTNIPLVDAVDGVIPISGMRDLLFGIADALEEESPWMWVLDEGGLIWNRSQPLRSESLGLAKLARVVPKLGGRLVYVDQVDAPSILELFAQDHIIATGHTADSGFTVLDYGGKKKSVRGVPKSTIYKSGSTGYFTIDVEMDKFLKALRDEGKTRQEQRIRAALK